MHWAHGLTIILQIGIEVDMPAITRLGDNDTGHGCWPPRPSSQASINVYVNGIAIHRQTDARAAHTCPSIPETHSSTLATGSLTVFINGKNCGRIGDSVTCGGFVAKGSGNVFAGG